MRKKIALLTGLVIYIGFAAWTFTSTPEPRGLLPAITYEWIGQSQRIKRLGFGFALMPLWCLAIHWRVHAAMPGIKQYLMTYSVINVPAFMTAGYLVYQLYSPDCLRTCPSGLQITMIPVWFFAATMTLIAVLVLLRLKQGKKA